MVAHTPLVLSHSARVALLGAELVANRLRARPDLRLILPTGHTPLGMYATLRAHAAEGSLPTERATLFQLDEYAGLEASDSRSYQAYLRSELDEIRFGRVHNLDGAASDLAAQCARHQALLDEAPVDLVVLGLGRDGHVAFDEPGSPLDGGVRMVELHPSTREDAAEDFGGPERVPAHALTVGLRTLIAARELLMLVTGGAKASALAAMLAGPVDPSCPASQLREHPRLTVVCDAEASAELGPIAGGASSTAIVVLGHRDATSHEQRISHESRARVGHALVECRRRPPRAVILTGYTRTPHGFSEAEQMKEYWPNTAAPALLETAGRNTAENATRSLPLIRAMGEIRRVVVVTSAWHLRTLYFFAPYRRFGLRLSFRVSRAGRWAPMLVTELRAIRRMRAQRGLAIAEMRLPPELALPPASSGAA